MSDLATTLCSPPPNLGVTSGAVTLATAQYTTALQKEYTGICKSLYGIAPSSFILEIQSILRAFGIQPSDSSLATEEFLIPMTLIALFTFTFGMIFSTYRKHWKIVLPLILILVLIWYIVYIRPLETFTNPMPSHGSHTKSL